MPKMQLMEENEGGIAYTSWSDLIIHNLMDKVRWLKMWWYCVFAILPITISHAEYVD